ncbi:ras-related small GTP-binding family protein [Artemisia annua]|uniref:Ras-related small GTP-binding family protein n=1 Tax=Artemisia annua TaxID=35608 RepID=A0A2U1P8S6_ARTAN|nr:ras-related small GTP-binding family protein [Artemisia annua]
MRHQHQQQEGSLYFHGSSKMSHLYRRIFRLDIRWSVILNKVSFFKEIFRFIWERFLACSIGKPAVRYRRLPRRKNSPVEDLEDPIIMVGGNHGGYESDSDLVTLKISLLGDCHIGKTSFMIKYVGDEQENTSLEMAGLNLMDKTLSFGGARIAFSIWDVGGDKRSKDQVPLACKDAVAILFMFDLTSRCTLNNVLEWYMQARKWNKTAIPILIGTKFDDFVRLPPDLQWTIVTQARAYAKVMKATLFFSSATHNINVNKIFKFIMARLFNLPWSLQPNLNLGEPIIDLY